ncbi:MAG: tripartite tricarboxylate transporter substrate binding protein [Candidatus Latescibacterota bacterium]
MNKVMVLVAALVFSLTNAVSAQYVKDTKKAGFPVKGRNMTIIVPVSAGGSTDVIARFVANGIAKQLGLPTQVVNKAGAAHQLGTTEMVRSKPDGYTMSMTNLPSVMMTYIDPKRKAVYGRKDLKQVANIEKAPHTIIVASRSPFKTLKDLVDAAKANPRTLRSSLSGRANDSHVALAMFEKAAGVEFRPVAFDGGAPAMTALLGGHVDLYFGTVPMLAPFMKSGEVRVLGIMDDKRSKFIPDVPTMESQGYKTISSSSRGFSVPGGTPDEIVGILSAAIKHVAESDEAKQYFDKTFLTPFYLDPAQYTAYWDEFEREQGPIMRQLVADTQ